MLVFACGVVFANLGRTAAPVSSSAGFADVPSLATLVSTDARRPAGPDFILDRLAVAWPSARHGLTVACLPRLCRCDAWRRGGFQFGPIRRVSRCHALFRPPSSTLAGHLAASPRAPGARQDPVKYHYLRISSPRHGQARATD
ncbi:hypothetical protein DFH06DRAFT_111429 [Mycena polygramma]|nr:hypothetical protein DFH06DRAFT_111429 [Mycena polygramma]